MRYALFLGLVFATGCVDTGGVAPAPQDDLFSAREVKLHPVFTRISDWTGDGKADGIDALVELHDQFGDTTKGAGTFMFELYEFRRDRPDPRGQRLSNPWMSDVITVDQQRARWSKTSRCYTFRLQSDVVGRGSYVFTVTYTPTSGPRSFDKVVLINHLATTQPDTPDGGAPLILPGQSPPLDTLRDSKRDNGSDGTGTSDSSSNR